MNTNKNRILIVDDEPAIRKVLEMALKMAGYEVASVDGRDAAIKACQKDDFALHIIDRNLIGVYGEDLAVDLHRINREGIFISMSGEDGENRNAPDKKSIFQFNLKKPFSISEVIEVASTYIADYQLKAS